MHQVWKNTKWSDPLFVEEWCLMEPATWLRICHAWVCGSLRRGWGMTVYFSLLRRPWAVMASKRDLYP